MNSKILIYNIIDSDRLMRVKVTACRMGLELAEVKTEQFALPLGYAAGLEGFEPIAEENSTESFSDEMLVICGLEMGELNELIDTLRRQNVIIPLKAMLTETNAKWSSLRLHREISAEHQAMKALAAKKQQPRHPVHKKRK